MKLSQVNTSMHAVSQSNAGDVQKYGLCQRLF